jgi:hypothetical protein
MVRMSRGSFGLLAVALAVLSFQVSPSADHSWKKYHWARSQNPFTLKLGDNVSSGWDTYLAEASQDWTQSAVLNTTIVGGGTSGSTCAPTSGRVEVCNAAYGTTGWLGVAQIWITRGMHIAQGTAKMNDTYFSQAQYDSPAWRRMVMCQEVAHTFGLDHQDENFNNANLGSCMDYTSDPDGPPSNEHPNQHDYDQLAAIYAHLDAFSTVQGSAAPASPGNPNNPSEWGQLVKVANGGRTQIFERELGNGLRLVTFVIWA